MVLFIFLIKVDIHYYFKLESQDMNSCMVGVPRLGVRGDQGPLTQSLWGGLLEACWQGEDYGRLLAVGG